MARTLWGWQDSVRLKVTDRCAWNCRWCHNEGTGARKPTIVGDVYWDEETESTFRRLSAVLPIHEVHLTGGEPTSHPDLPSLISGLIKAGYRVKATSVGCNEELLRSVIASGLACVNFSVHSIDPQSLLQTQNGRTERWCEHQLAQLMRCVDLAVELGVEVKINTVISEPADIVRVERVLDWARAKGVPLRILNDLGTGADALAAVALIIEQSHATLLRTRYLHASSSFTSYYGLPDGYEFGVKRIRPYYLAGLMCSRCEVRKLGKCSEGFYGLRLQRRQTPAGWQLEVRLCVHRSDADTVMSVPAFLHSRQLAQLQAQFHGNDSH